MMNEKHYGPVEESLTETYPASSASDCGWLEEAPYRSLEEEVVLVSHSSTMKQEVWMDS